MLYSVEGNGNMTVNFI